MFKGIMALVLMAILAGCASSGNRSLQGATQESISSSIVEGQTSKAEIQEMFGGPTSASFGDEGREIWVYTLAQMSADARSFVPFVGLLGQSGSGSQKNLAIMFDDDDVVHRYTFTESDIGYGTGIFR